MKIYQKIIAALLLSLIPSMAYTPPNTNGQAVSTNSSPVVIASDQSTVFTQSPQVMQPGVSTNVTTTGAYANAQVIPGQLISLCLQVTNVSGATNSLTSATTTSGSNTITMASTTGVQLGQNVIGTGVPTGSFIVSFVANTSITLNVPCSASGTVTLTVTSGQLAGNWQYSPNNSSWTNLSVMPKTLATQAAPVTAENSAGLWLAQVPQGALFIRFNLTTISGYTINAFVDNYQVGCKINLPLFYCSSATSANFPTGGCFVPPVETSGLADYNLDLTSIAGTTQTLAIVQTNDPLLQNPEPAIGSPNNNPAGALGASYATSTSSYWINIKSKYLVGKVSYATLTGWTLGGFSARVSLTEFPSVQQVALTQVGGNTIATASPGASGFGQVFELGQPVTNVDYSSQAWAATSGSGATITAAPGTSVGYEINVSAFSAGSSTGLDIFMQASPDAGTNWYDIWQVPAFTSTGTDYIPPLTVPGVHRRIRWVNRGGAATTATVTATAMECSHSAISEIQFFDRSSTLLSGTLNATSASYNLWGCKTVNVWICLGAATTAGTYQLQVSPDASNWASVGTATIGVASSTVNFQVANISARFARVICTIAAVGQTGTYIGITGTQ